MSFIFILAQILALVACGLNVISMQCKTRKNILLFFLLGNVVGATGLLLLKAYAGALIQFVFGFQTLINYIYAIKNKKITWKLITFYITLSIVASIITFKSWIDIIPLISAILHTITIIQIKENRIRLVNLSSLLLWIPYYIVFDAYANLFTNLCIVVSNVVSIIRYDVKKETRKSYRESF